MNLTLTLGKRIYEVYGEQAIDLAIPLDFSGKQPNVHGIRKAFATTHESEGFIGDTKRGGSCNWQEYTLTPHSHGTHTESVGHLTFDPFDVNHNLHTLLIPSVLISVQPEKGSETEESYIPSKFPEDLLVTQRSLEEKLKLIPMTFCQGVIIRTLPNPPEKCFRDYHWSQGPFFSIEAMAYLKTLNVEHLLVDFPSIDRMHDEGILHNHRTFWNIEPGSKQLPDPIHRQKTITELIYVPESAKDGLYCLNLQIPSFSTDAAPSRPLIFPLKSVS